MKRNAFTIVRSFLVKSDRSADVLTAIWVEWARAHARKLRWEEEVLLLREEMRRVLRYLAWQSRWWRERVGVRADDVPREVTAGIDAYALKQADLHDRLAAFFRRKWEMGALTAARQLVAFEDAAEVEDADLESFFQ
jgi:hypothetical protein